jgi:hypothetical protein
MRNDIIIMNANDYQIKYTGTLFYLKQYSNATIIFEITLTDIWKLKWK